MRLGTIKREKEYRQFLKGLGSYLNAYMVVTGTTQGEIAKRAGLANSTISKIVRMERHAVMTSTLWNILDVV